MRLVEYVDYPAESGGEAVQAPKKPLDVSCVMGGATGFAAAMIGHAVVRGTGTSSRLNEATYGLFGRAGTWPNYIFLLELKERDDRGQRSLATVMRVKTSDSRSVRSVCTFLWGDGPRFQLERLAVESFAPRGCHSRWFRYAP